VAYDPSTVDPTRKGDARYWWSAAEVGRLRRVVAPEFADRLSIAGTPKGRRLAALRSEFGAEEGVIFDGGPMTQMAEPLRLSLARWRGADPEKTYLIISHVLGPSLEERARSQLSDGLPVEAEDLRRDWVAALEAGDESEPMLREQLDAELESLGHLRHSDVLVFDPRKAVEVSPAIFVQDERPNPR
jgi:hypothetical protein